MDISIASLGSLAKLGTGVRSRRWSSYDKTGGNADYWMVPAGVTLTLGKMEGPGSIRHIWMTTAQDDNNLRRLILRMYWDGEVAPSVLCPLGAFFGLGHAKATYFESMPLQASYLGLNCWFPMPYSEGARITITNDSDRDTFLYFYIDYQEWDKPRQDTGRFHACWRRRLVVKKKEREGENALGKRQRLNTTGDENYVILDVEGRGHYVGCCLHIDTNEPGWWGEGDDMFFIDGEPWPPSLHGTGTEDYFCGAWSYNRLRQTYCTPTAPRIMVTISKVTRIIQASIHNTASTLKTQYTSENHFVSVLSMGMPMTDRGTGQARRIGIKSGEGNPYRKLCRLKKGFRIHSGDWSVGQVKNAKDYLGSFIWVACPLR